MSQGQIQKNIFFHYIHKNYRRVTKPIESTSYQISCEGYNEYKLGLKQRKYFYKINSYLAKI